MAKLTFRAPNNDKPVKVTVELAATVHRDLVVYADYPRARAASPRMIQQN
jgi:hypothetical protein